ncbi:MAG: hypothetical protein LBG66_04260 [Gallionellaceae bacterium]|nr:hypothetical protein [Gallionellaceae bacterium]
MAAGFFAAGFFAATAFLAAGFLAATFLAAGFFATAFLAAGFLAATFLAAGFFAAVAFLAGAAAFLAAGFFFATTISISLRLVENKPLLHTPATPQNGMTEVLSASNPCLAAPRQLILARKKIPPTKSPAASLAALFSLRALVLRGSHSACASVDDYRVLIP